MSKLHSILVHIKRYLHLEDIRKAHGGYKDPILILEIKRKHTKCVQKLLHRFPHIDVNAPNVYGETALTKAVEHKDVECVRALLSHDNIDVSVVHGPVWAWSPLIKAALLYQHEEKQIIIFDMLLAHRNVDVNEEVCLFIFDLFIIRIN
jgi:hypothetical protein